jgi:two-component system, LytTR family, response regulator
MRALVVDDEAPARAKVRRLLEASIGVEVVGEATTGREALAAIKRTRPDVVFLDIQMPGLDGFGVADAIQNDGGPYIVFVTANDQHALRAFEVGAVDYLLKPFTPTRFEQVLERARERLAASRVAPPAAAPPATHLKRVLVIDDGRAHFVAVDAIDRVEAERNYVVLHSRGQQHRLRATLASLAERLDPSQFLRVNRSTLVRLDAVREMHEWSHGDFRVVMHDGEELIWSRRYRAAAEREFGVRG